MLTKDQKIEIKRLKEEGKNISQIAERMKLDWKTVKKYLAQNDDNVENKLDLDEKQGDSQDENELMKMTFERLNNGICPREIVAQIGHVDLVTDLWKKWRSLYGNTTEDLRLPDPRMVEDFEPWEESVGKFFEWHLKKAIKAVAGLAWVRLRSCANYMNKDVECAQIGRVDDPYECLSCWSCSMFS
jgi:hypothetical protein